MSYVTLLGCFGGLILKMARGRSLAGSTISRWRVWLSWVRAFTAFTIRIAPRLRRDGKSGLNKGCIMRLRNEFILVLSTRIPGMLCLSVPSPVQPSSMCLAIEELPPLKIQLRRRHTSPPLLPVQGPALRLIPKPQDIIIARCRQRRITLYMAIPSCIATAILHNRDLMRSRLCCPHAMMFWCDDAHAEGFEFGDVVGT